MSGLRAEQAASFGSASGEYERGRPAYPAAAVDWLLPHGSRQVLDLGAGTGKLTRALVERGLDVTAVEPSAGMRAQLAAALPGASCLAGSAEAVPLADASVDAVLVAQAWHWVDPDRAVPEVARVLRPGGRLGLVWNVRDERAAWVAALGRLLDAVQDEATEIGTGDLGGAFGEVEEERVAWVHRLSPALVLDLVASRSYVITLPAAERSALLAGVRALLEAHPDTAGRAELDLPYVTHCFRASAR